MAVVVECLNVIVPRSVIAAKYPGGVAQYRADCPNATFTEDDHLTRVGFMDSGDVESFGKTLTSRGLVFLDGHGKSVDIVVVDMLGGPTTPCEWVEFSAKRGARCWLRGARPGRVARPKPVATVPSLCSPLVLNCSSQHPQEVPMLDSLWLVHHDDDMLAAFRERFAGLPHVRVVKGGFEDLEPHDCFVTAGNAFGLMTAGIDALVVRRFGERLMRRVQHRIMDEYLGEQPVGTAFIVATEDPALPFLCHAPTMRKPATIDGTDKVYAATWAALLAVQAHNRASAQRIGVVALPAMGTGYGRVPFGEAARQMAVAYRHFLEPPHRLDKDYVARRQRSICYDGRRQVVR